MKRRLISIVVLLTGALSSVPAQEQSPINPGKALYQQNCATCHGQKADKTAMGQSAKLRELSEGQFIEQLAARRNGSKPSVANVVKSRLSDADILLLARYVTSLRSD